MNFVKLKNIYVILNISSIKIDEMEAYASF